MRRIIALPSFARSAKKLSSTDKDQLVEALEQFNNFIFIGELPFGLGFKKIGQGKYELRVGLRLRIVVKAESDTYYLVFIGNHDEVKKYLRHYR